MSHWNEAGQSRQPQSPHNAASPRNNHRAFSPQFYQLDEVAPRLKEPERMTGWTLRAQNFVVQIVQAMGDVELPRVRQTDEYMVVLASTASSATFTTEFGSSIVDGRSVVIVPPGDSVIKVRAGSLLVELFSAAATDLLHGSSNRAYYDNADPRVPSFRSWPAPSDGYALRCYSVDEVAKDASRLGRIYQSSIGMVNFFHPEDGPRDDSKLTPHAHDDFEQCTVQLLGDYVHHIRTPWGERLADWRPDQHRLLTGPGVTLIPARSIHTTQAVHPGPHQLLDLFAPPRIDWVKRAGWVVNSNDYQVLPDPSGDGG